MDKNEEDIKKAHSVFENDLSYEDFVKKLEVFEDNDKWNFIRSCLMFISAKKCGEIDNNIKNLLLCISIEAISNEDSKMIPFREWIKKYLERLENKTEEELKKELEKLNQEYLMIEEREGALFNFKKFIKTYCSEELKNSPIITKLSKDFKNKEFIDFDFSLEYIYSKFRSLFTHRAIGRIKTTKSLGIFSKDTIIIGDSLLDIYKNKGVHVDMNNILDWFEKIVYSSLLNYLSNPNAR